MCIEQASALHIIIIIIRALGIKKITLRSGNQKSIKGLRSKLAIMQ